MFDCTTHEYERLYAPWLEEPLTLPVLTKWSRDEPLLDLCGGTGVVSQALLVPQPSGTVPSPKVTLFDLNPRPDPKWADRQQNLGRFRSMRGDANRVGSYFEPGSFGVVICRQSMGYLDPAKAIPGVAKILCPGGRFAFNTFEEPRAAGAKTRRYGGVRFVEAHVCLFGRIVHLQARLDHGPGADVSVFRYWPRDHIHRLLTLHRFDVHVEDPGRSVRWVATKGVR